MLPSFILSLLCLYLVGAGILILKSGGGARKHYPIPIILLLVFSMSEVIVYSVFSCTVSVPDGGAVVYL